MRGPSWVMKRWASARCCETTLLYFQISFPVRAPLPVLSKLASLFKFPSSAAVPNFGCWNGMINSPSFRSQLSTGCHLKQLRAVAPLSWERMISRRQRSPVGCLSVGAKPPCHEWLREQAITPRRDGLLAGTLKAGAMVIGTSGDILLISVAVKTPPTQQKLPVPSLLQSLTSVF